jgi:hypothetical protein
MDWILTGVRGASIKSLAGGHDINIVVQFRPRFGSELSERAAPHQNRFVAGGSTSKGSPNYSNPLSTG